jgi:2-aminobenzoylacetyl-CoA thioesterase
MRIRKPGQITEGLYLLGLEESCTYLLEGRDESMLINGGMNYSVPVILDQFKAFGIDEAKITKILLLHAHFDHVGIVPFFKRRHPRIEIMASNRGWEILSMPKAIDTINVFSRKAAEHLGRLDFYDNGYDLDWTPDITGSGLTEGDRMDLGDLAVEIYETPGHSSCSISAYVPALKVLFPSDAGGVPFKETKVISGNSNYSLLQQSIEKLKRFETDVICADHYGYVTGDEARGYIEDSSLKAAADRAWMERAYRESGTIEGAARIITSEFLKENYEHLTPPDLFEAVCRQTLRHIVSTM